MKTKIEIINETVEYYKNNPRAVCNGTCNYYRQGKMCAVGRCCIDPIEVQQKFPDKSVNVFDIEPYLKHEYRGHGRIFWNNLQSLHDHDINWDGNQLTANGKLYLQTLLWKWSDVT